MARFTSRKFLLCLAAFLGSIGTSIAALHTDNQRVASVGMVCAILSAAIYAMVEAYVDGKAVDAEQGIDLEDIFFDEEYEEDDEEEEVAEDEDEEEIETRANIEKKEA